MRREAPKIFRRYMRANNQLRVGQVTRDGSFILKAAEVAEKYFYEIGAEKALQAEGFVFEGELRTADGKCSSADRDLFGWTVKRRFMELIDAHRSIGHPLGTA
jgi:hypothetical protein